MIIVTRLNGPPFALNPDLIERADATPDTVLTLEDGWSSVSYGVRAAIRIVVLRVRRALPQAATFRFGLVRFPADRLHALAGVLPAPAFPWLGGI